MGIQVFVTALDNRGLLVLDDILKTLAVECNIKRLMVEGGACVVESFLRSSRFDKLIVTISPQFIGGINILPKADSTTLTTLGKDDKSNLKQHSSEDDITKQPKAQSRFANLVNVHYEKLGNNLIVIAEPEVDCKGR